MKMLTYDGGGENLQEVILCDRHADAWLIQANRKGVRERYDVADADLDIDCEHEECK